MPAKNKIEIEIEVTSNGELLVKTAEGVEKFGKSAEGAAPKAKILDGAMERIGQKAVDLVAQLPAMIVDLGKLGVQSEATAFRFEKFAGSEERATELLGAFVDATDNTINRMDAMAGAGRLLQMGLVENADEMGNVAAIATKLGDQTMGAGDRVADFAALLANQSIPRLDNFGISSGRVRKRIEELQAATKNMSREEAFKIAVMEEGQKALNTLGDSNDLAKVKVDKLTAAVDDAKIGIGEMIAEMALGSIEVDDFSARIRGLPETIKQISIIGGAIAETVDPLKDASSETKAYAFALANPQFAAFVRNIEVMKEGIDEYTPAIAKALAGTDAIKESMQELHPPVDGVVEIVNESADAWNDYESAINLADIATEDSGANFDQYTMAIEESTAAMDQAAISAVDFANEQVAIQEALTKTQTFLLDQTLEWTDFYRDREEQQADAAADLEAIEEEHQANLDDIARRGQSSRRQIDVGAEELNLKILEAQLAEKLVKQSEFDEETSELTRLRTQKEITALQTEIGTKTELLGSAQEGWITMQGENAAVLLAAEEERYAAELALQQEAQALQEEEQRLSLGRMVLQSFEAWAAQKGIAAEQMLEMRTAISLEYGLIDEAAAFTIDTSVARWEAWAETGTTTADSVVADIDRMITGLETIPTDIDPTPHWSDIVADNVEADAARIKTAIDNIPSRKTITIQTINVGGTGGWEEQAQRQGVPPEALGLSQGADFIVPPGFENDSFGPIFVESDERVTVTPANQTTNNFNQTIHSRATTEQSSGGFRMMQSMVSGG